MKPIKEIEAEMTIDDPSLITVKFRFTDEDWSERGLPGVLAHLGETLVSIHGEEIGTGGRVDYDAIHDYIHEGDDD